MTRDYETVEESGLGTIDTPVSTTHHGNVTTARTIIKPGWDAVVDIKTADSPYATRLRVEDEPSIIYFLSDEPYASWRQHWVERQGQKSFVCLAGMDDDGCPLCDIGSRPAVRIAFNCLLLSTSGEHSLRSYEVGPRVIDQLKNFHNDPRTGPISKHFWAVSRTGKGPTSATAHQLVRERDLEEWGITSPAESEISKWRDRAYTADIININTRLELIDIASEES